MRGMIGSREHVDNKTVNQFRIRSCGKSIAFNISTNLSWSLNSKIEFFKKLLIVFTMSQNNTVDNNFLDNSKR